MNEHMTLEEIGLALGITKQSVHEILKKALNKVETKLKERGIKMEDLL